MTRDTYDKATVALDKTLKLQGLRDKIKRDIPELGFDKQLKEWVVDDLFKMIEAKIKESADEFDKSEYDKLASSFERAVVTAGIGWFLFFLSLGLNLIL